MGQHLHALVTEACDLLAGESAVVAGENISCPRFELFHAPNSICSQKVRAVLAYHGLPYLSDPVNLFKGESYLPGYVRLRMMGCESLGVAMASHHSGSTSTEAGGCDGAVVPTLVDWEQGSVIVDSKRICLHIDAQQPEENRLCPIELDASVSEILTIVDNIPNYQMLMGRTPGATEASDTKASTGGEFSKRKVEWCDRYLKEFVHDEVLAKAYSAKRAKELSAANELFSAEAMDAAYKKVDLALNGLEMRLSENESKWIFGNFITMADLFWTVELLRMKNMGMASFWTGRLPEVETFLESAADLPCIRSAVLEWPGSTF